jgi:hypothetical protein
MASQTTVIAPEHQAETSDGRSKQRWPAIVALLILCNGLAFYFGSKRSAEPPRLLIDEDELTFGEAHPVPDFEHSITLHNPTALTIEATLTASCKCTRFAPRHLVIPAGESRTAAVALNLIPLNNAEAAEPVRPFDVDIVAELGGTRPGRQRWTLTGEVTAPVTLETGMIRFDGELVRGTDFRAKSILVRLHQPASSVQASCDPLEAECAVTAVSGKPDEFQLQVLPSEKLLDGPFQFFVALLAVSADGKETVGNPLRVGGTVWPEVRLSPSRLDLGAMRQGSRRTISVELQSRSGREFTISSISDATAAVFRCDLPIGPARSHSVEFEVTCDAVGPMSEEVEIELQFGELERATIVLPVSVYGIEEQLHKLNSTKPAAAG